MIIDSEDVLGPLMWLVIVIACLFGVYKCTSSDWYTAQQRAEEAQAAADARPHVIREADGCKVYAFKSGSDWHYFTRCGSEVSTERNWSERHGKTTEHKSETIVTEGNS
ncbi:hypothetical protein AB4Y32_25280 [Paraburkholderia phymatum]|uniref:Uncharacterized protein n=1 Tax=Paraburkholderia phymatum TaxID=148447 RepID=A0ACC6U619_9BURK